MGCTKKAKKLEARVWLQTVTSLLLLFARIDDLVGSRSAVACRGMDLPVLKPADG